MLKYIIGAAAVIAVAALGVATQFNATPDNLRIGGYDPVSYFQEDGPKRGAPEFSVAVDGAVYYFASAENRAAFNTNRTKYTPEYSGFCSYGVSLGQKFKVDPTAYRIVNGRLFLQLDPGTREIWMEAEAENIRLADQNWPDVRGLPAP